MPVHASAAADVGAKKVVVQTPNERDHQNANSTAVEEFDVSPPGTATDASSTSSHKCFDGLALRLESSEQISRALQKNDFQTAAKLLRTAFSLRSPPLPPSHFLQLSQAAALAHQYDREAEDAASRDDILTGLYVEACAYALSVGFTTWQMAVWITVFAEAHAGFIVQLGSRDADDPNLDPSKLCVDVFMETLVPHNYQQKSAQNQTFSQQETMYLIDYWTQVYMKHLRLLTFVFTQPQDVEWTFYRAHLDEPTQVRDMRGEILPTVDHRPLVDAIPAEKWDEYCRNEENKRLEKEREEQEEAQRAKLKLEEEAAAAVQAAKDLELAQAEPALTILPPTLPCPPPPDPATLFASAPEPSHALTPSEIAQSLVSTIDMHITALMTHLDKCLEHQMGEMSRIVDTVTGDKDGGKKGGKEDKVKARTGTPAASEKGGEREKEARPPSSVKKSAKSAKAKK